MKKLTSKPGILVGMILVAALCLAVWVATYRTVVYARSHGRIVYTVQKSGDYSHLYVTNILGFPQRRLSEWGHWDVSPSFSPDGKKVAFECQEEFARLCIIEVYGRDEIKIDTETGRVFDIQWSPDGSRLVFSGDNNIHLVNIDGTNLNQLTNDRLSKFSPVISPDGNWIVYVAESPEGGEFDIFRVGIDGTDQRNLTKNPASDGSAVISPDGDDLFFSSDRTGNDDIYRLAIQSGELVNLTRSEDDEGGLSLSPDGNWLTYEVHYKDAPSPERDIFLMRLADGEITQLTRSGGYDGQPIWSPDGQMIAFISDRLGSWNAFVMHADGSSQLPIYLGGSSNVVWGP